MGSLTTTKSWSLKPLSLNIGTFNDHKNIVFEKAPFQYSEYEEYCYMLINGIGLYRKAGDVASADVCEQELIRTYEKVMSLDDRLSGFGRKIKDQPVTELPEDIVRYVNALEE